MKKFEYSIATSEINFYNITAQIQEAISQSNVNDGIAIIFCPHTTAGITINENADPEAIRDIIFGLREVYPNRPEFKHGGGNSDAHLKASTIGSSVTVIIENGKIILGMWQAIYFCEFDPPRNRKYYVVIID